MTGTQHIFLRCHMKQVKHTVSLYRTGNICCRREAMKRYIGTCLPHAGRYMQSRTGAVHRFLYCRSPFFAIAASLFCYCRIIFLLLPHHFFAIAASFFANCNEKIAAPRRTCVTNSTKICRTSLVARYAAPPCVTRYAATYIASTVYNVSNSRLQLGFGMHGRYSNTLPTRSH